MNRLVSRTTLILAGVFVVGFFFGFTASLLYYTIGSLITTPDE